MMLTWLQMPIWAKWPNAAGPFDATYSLGFIIAAPMALSILFWSIAGWPHLTKLLQRPSKAVWLSTLLLLLIWTWLSQSWAFAGQRAPGVAQNVTLQLALIAAFLVASACIAPRRAILYSLIANMLLHGVLGGLQVAVQGNVGLEVFALNPEKSGVSVVLAEGVRWLRPYGLLSHPNIYAGILLVGLIATAWWVVTTKRWQIMALIAFGCGLWMLMLSFSRSAWLGFVVGALFALFFVLRRGLWRRLLWPTALALMAGGIFFTLYQPFLLARAGVGLEGTEQRSIADRVVYWQIAEDAIASSPIIGVGAGHFPWYAADYLFYRTDYDLRGANVHNVPLLVWSELGLVGLVLLSIHLGAATIAILKQRDLDQVALLAATLALFVVGLFDHYTWSLIHTQTLWLGLLAVALAPRQGATVAVGSSSGTSA